MTLERAKVELKNYITLAGSTIRKKKDMFTYKMNELNMEAITHPNI